MPALAPSLKGLFATLDFLWPNRDRRTDGWYRSPADGKSTGHNPGHNGYSHAIDVDKDGINPMWIIDHIARRSDVMYYIIWDVRVWSTETGWNGHPYQIPKGGSDHRDHMHIEIHQTNFAEQFGGPWLGDGSGGGGGGGGGGGDGGLNSGLEPADTRDYRDAMYATADWSLTVAGQLAAATNSIIQSTQY